jgi:hypothetical protein
MNLAAVREQTSPPHRARLIRRAEKLILYFSHFSVHTSRTSKIMRSDLHKRHAKRWCRSFVYDKWLSKQSGVWRHQSVCWIAINNAHPNAVHICIFLISRDVRSVTDYIRTKPSVSNGVICIANGSKTSFSHRCSKEPLISCFCLSLNSFYHNLHFMMLFTRLSLPIDTKKNLTFYIERMPTS